MDPNVLKLLCYVYKDKIFSHCDKLILISHWTLIRYGFRVDGEAEQVTNIYIVLLIFIGFNNTEKYYIQFLSKSIW
jgi:hypothetical protein